MDKKCETCRLFISERAVCARTSTITAPFDSCSHWVKELPKCSVCGRWFVSPITYYTDNTEDESPRLLCGDCFANRSSCKTCANGGYCDFQENTAVTEPPMIQRTVRQGNMVMTHTVPNPARIELTCKKNCKCYHAETDCCARGNFDTCANYIMKGDKTNV